MQKKTSGYYRDEFNKFAWLYDPALRVSGLLLGGEENFRKGLLRLLEPKKGQRILDIGCGTGSMAVLLGEMLQDRADVIGIDLSDGMLKIAKRKIRKRGFKRVKCLKENAEALPFPDAYFDSALTTAVLHEMNRLGRFNTIKEVYRVLKPEGLFLVLDYNLPERGIGKIISGFFLKVFEGETAIDMLERGIEKEVTEATKGGLRLLKKAPLILGTAQALLFKKEND